MSAVVRYRTLGGSVTNAQWMEVADALFQLDPVRTYARRGATAVARLAGIRRFRLDHEGGSVTLSEPPAEPGERSVALPLRNGRDTVGTLHLYPDGGPAALDGQELRAARWAAKLLARGMTYTARLSRQGGLRRSGEELEEALSRTPLTRRERDVVVLLVAGGSTRDIASRTGLTVSTVNTYLKRIFGKLGVHSRVELIARMAGTAEVPPESESDDGPRADGAPPS